MVEEYWVASGLDKTVRLKVPGEHRCGQCNKLYKRHQDLKAHWTRKKLKGGCQLKEGSRAGSLAEKDLKRRQQKVAQADIGEVMLGADMLENVFEFKYLGHLFQADGCCW